MDTLKILPALLLLACERDTPPAPLALLSAEACMCPCACDAPVADAAQPDAPAPPEIDLEAEWTMHVIAPGTATRRGADGAARDPDGCWIVPWEQGNIVTRSCRVDGTWQTTTVATASAPEDAKSADLDGDGALDVVIASAQRVLVAFGSGGPLITLTASQGHGNVMQVAIADFDGDAHLDVVFGSLGVVALLRNPGPANARTPDEWEYELIRPAGWAMSVLAVDVNNDQRMDVVVSDRAKVMSEPDIWALYGTRWSEQMSDGTWQTRQVSLPTGPCTPYTSPTCATTPGDAMFVAVGDDGLVVTGSSSNSKIGNRVVLYPGFGADPAQRIVMPLVAEVGYYQHATRYDVDGDGDRDLVISTWIHGSLPLTAEQDARSGVYWMRNNGDGTWSRGEATKQGAKFDNIERFEATRCSITTEQLEDLGLVLLCPPGAEP